MKHEMVVPKKPFEFTVYYRTAAETNEAVKSSKNTTNTKKEEKIIDQIKPSKKSNQKQQTLDDSRIDIEGDSLNKESAPSPSTIKKVKSTIKSSFNDKDNDGPQCNPNKSKKHNIEAESLSKESATSTPSTIKKVKSIMKSPSDDKDNDDFQYNPNKSKKRNKSVSFMLGDTEELAIKKVKSNEAINTTLSKNQIKKLNKNKKGRKGKENKLDAKFDDVKEVLSKSTDKSSDHREEPSQEVHGTFLIKKRKRKTKMSDFIVHYSNDPAVINDSFQIINNDNQKEIKKSYVKNSNLNTKPKADSGTNKKDGKPEAIVENLQNLSIGDNPHTLTNLLDDMKVADKDKRKKNKAKANKEAIPVASTSVKEPFSILNKEEEVKEKIKWKKRKWNKDQKSQTNEELVQNTIVVDNLPFSMICTYKKLLTDHFIKYGLIKKIGVAELYPAQRLEQVFTTNVVFYSDGAAAKALEEDSGQLGETQLELSRALPAEQTTLVVRSYGELNDQELSTAFHGAGRIRSTRYMVKGKKSIGTAFVEFDGPKAVERALQVSSQVQIAKKRLYASRFESRQKQATNNNSETE